jgi:hypothetical protein
MIIPLLSEIFCYVLDLYTYCVRKIQGIEAGCEVVASAQVHLRQRRQVSSPYLSISGTS